MSGILLASGCDKPANGSGVTTTTEIIVDDTAPVLNAGSETVDAPSTSIVTRTNGEFVVLRTPRLNQMFPGKKVEVTYDEMKPVDASGVQIIFKDVNINVGDVRDQEKAYSYAFHTTPGRNKINFYGNYLHVFSDTKLSDAQVNEVGSYIENLNSNIISGLEDTKTDPFEFYSGFGFYAASPQELLDVLPGAEIEAEKLNIGEWNSQEDYYEYRFTVRNAYPRDGLKYYIYEIDLNEYQGDVAIYENKARVLVDEELSQDQLDGLKAILLTMDQATLDFTAPEDRGLINR